VHYPVRSSVLRRVTGQVQAVDGVTLEVTAGSTVALVGESGSGKSTLGRVGLGLVEPTRGRVLLDGIDVAGLGNRAMRPLRRHGQMVFQDPYSSLDPRATVIQSVSEPLLVHSDMGKREREERVSALLELVQLDPSHMYRYPHQFSGGQLQRIALARALTVEPSLIVADEPVSSLDVSTQATVLSLLRRLQRELGVAYLFISHDLSVVRNLSHQIAVMYLGRIVEFGDAPELCSRPLHPYTEALLSAVPYPDPVHQRSRKRIVLSGELPSASNPPQGCRFHSRCPYVMDICRVEDPEQYENDRGGLVFCHLHTSGPQLAGETVRQLQTDVSLRTEGATAVRPETEKPASD
jgi:oligopeptide/dipeptide ABC transporter ATP-binding protein